MGSPTSHLKFPFLLVATALLLQLGSVLAQPDPLRVAATVGMIGDVARNVGGECAEVTSIMGSGVDPHVYQASARDVSTFQRADLILYGGYFLEGQLGEVLDGFSRRKPTVAVSEEAVSRQELITTQDAYGVDPHLWMDVSLWARTVPVIVQAFAELRPDCSELFEDNAEVYLSRLDALHDWVAQAVATIPEEFRILITAHDAFSYFGRAYGIEVAGIQGISTESEAGVADIRKMADLVSQRQVPALFIESTINPRTIQAVVEAAEQRGHRVEIGSQLYSDALGAQGSAGGSYIGMIYSNVSNIVSDLGGEVEPLPAQLSEWAQRWGIAARDE